MGKGNSIMETFCLTFSIFPPSLIVCQFLLDRERASLSLSNLKKYAGFLNSFFKIECYNLLLPHIF